MYIKELRDKLARQNHIKNNSDRSELCLMYTQYINH